MRKTEIGQSVARAGTALGTQRKPRRELLWGAAALIVLVAMYWQVGQVWLARWFETPAYYHCVAVPAIAGWLLWRRWERLTEEQPSASGSALALLVMGLVLYWVFARTGVRIVAGLALPVILAGIVGAMYGMRTLRIVAAPIAVLIFAVPFPEHAIGMAAMPMQQVSAVIAGKAAPLLGLSVVQQGITLDLHGFDFVVAQECSGMHSLVALLLTGFVLVELSGLGPFRRVAAIAIIVPLVLFANVVRLVFVLLLAEYLGADFALGVVVHGFSDLVVYFAAVLSFVLFIGWLYDTQRQMSAPEPEEGIAEEEPEAPFDQELEGAFLSVGSDCDGQPADDASPVVAGDQVPSE